jgi:hypothetical protein
MGTTAAQQAKALEQTEAPEKFRITVDMTAPLKNALDRLAARDGITQAQVLRNAIAVLNAIKEAQAKGDGEPALVKDGNVTYKLVGF